MVQQGEAKMVNDWLWQFHNKAPQWRRVRLGVLPDKKLNRAYITTLRWADAIFIEDGFVNIVEAKLKADLGAIGQLEAYAELFKSTPEFSQWWNWDIKLHFLSPVFDTTMAEMLSKKNIEYHLYEIK